MISDSNQGLSMKHYGLRVPGYSLGYNILTASFSFLFCRGLARIDRIWHLWFHPCWMIIFSFQSDKRILRNRLKQGFSLIVSLLILRSTTLVYQVVELFSFAPILILFLIQDFWTGMCNYQKETPLYYSCQ